MDKEVEEIKEGKTNQKKGARMNKEAKKIIFLQTPKLSERKALS